MNSSEDPATVEANLRLGNGFAASERDHILEMLVGLNPRLRSYAAGTVDLLLSVKERDGAGQKTTLEARVAGTDRVVATSDNTVIDRALIEVRDDVVRQLTDAKNRTEPRQNRHRRDTSA